MSRVTNDPRAICFVKSYGFVVRGHIQMHLEKNCEEHITASRTLLCIIALNLSTHAKNICTYVIVQGETCSALIENQETIVVEHILIYSIEKIITGASWFEVHGGWPKKGPGLWCHLRGGGLDSTATMF